MKACVVAVGPHNANSREVMKKASVAVCICRVKGHRDGNYWRGIRVPTRQAMYVQRNIEERLCNVCFGGKTIEITCSEPVAVALGIQHKMRLRYNFKYGLPNFTKLFHIISQTVRFSDKKCYWAQNVCFDFLYNFCLKNFSF